MVEGPLNVVNKFAGNVFNPWNMSHGDVDIAFDAPKPYFFAQIIEAGAVTAAIFIDVRHGRCIVCVDLNDFMRNLSFKSQQSKLNRFQLQEIDMHFCFIFRPATPCL